MDAFESFGIEVAEGDISDHAADVIVLKYAQGFFGADKAIATRLVTAGEELARLMPAPGAFSLVSGRAAVNARHVLFVGVSDLYKFEYVEVRSFSKLAMEVISAELPDVTAITMTIHGAGYGLDEIESFESQLGGIFDAERSGLFPKNLERITFVERNTQRFEIIERALKAALYERPKITPKSIGTAGTQEERTLSAPTTSDAKDRVFVAMPFKEEMDDLYHYGIQAAVRDAGFICERSDHSAFTGDVLTWVRDRIRTARLLIADLSEPNPNVYLEVGYAWGVGIPTLLVANDTNSLMFDVRGQRCLIYTRIRDLEDALRDELRKLLDARAI